MNDLASLGRALIREWRVDRVMLSGRWHQWRIGIISRKLERHNRDLAERQAEAQFLLASR